MTHGDPETISRRFRIFAQANNIKDDILMRQVEDKVVSALKREDQRSEFVTTDALRARLRAPSKTVFDRRYQPANALDKTPVEEVITYNQYKLRQLLSLGTSPVGPFGRPAKFSDHVIYHGNDLP